MTYHPDMAEIQRWRYERAVEEFKEGGSVAVLKTSLKSAGYYATRLEDELRYQVMLRDGSVKKYEGFASGLPARS